MAVTMEDVRRILDAEEPDYEALALLGADSLPHLQKLAAGPDPMLASKAVYAASLVDTDAGRDLIAAAATSDQVLVRLAAAGAAANLSAAAASAVLLDLVRDPDDGVRKRARNAVPDDASDELRAAVGENGEDRARGESGVGAGAIGTGQLSATMPGEEADASRMPGEVEGAGLMPGEQPSSGTAPSSGRMPGER